MMAETVLLFALHACQSALKPALNAHRVPCQCLSGAVQVGNLRLSITLLLLQVA